MSEVAWASFMFFVVYLLWLPTKEKRE